MASNNTKNTGQVTHRTPQKSLKDQKTTNVSPLQRGPTYGPLPQQSWSAPSRTVYGPRGGQDNWRNTNRPAGSSSAQKYAPSGQFPSTPGQQAGDTQGPRPLQKSSNSDGHSSAACPKPKAVPLGIGVKVDSATVHAVEITTRGQRENPQWFSWRQNRITASTAHRVSRSRFVNGKSATPPESYLTAILGEGPNVKTRAMTWGIQHEATAVRIYEKMKSKLLGRPINVRECGLFIDLQKAWLAASPDGIVEDKKTGEHLLCLEVKCPYKHRENTVRDACCQDSAFCLELNEEGDQVYRLKTNHSYYTQVQCQMAVTGLCQCDLVVYTLRETAIVPVAFDPEFWDKTVVKLEKFYCDAVLPRLREKKLTVPEALPEE